MKEVKKIAIITIHDDEKGNYIVDGFTNTQINISAFIEEMRHMGAVLSKDAVSFKIPIDKVSDKRLHSCINAYFGKGVSISSGQRKWKEKLFNEVLNDDCLFKKDGDGIFVVDPYQSSGTINEIKQDLANAGIAVKKVVNKKRVYIELPSGVSLPSTSSKKKTKSKNNASKNNKNLEDGDMVKYLGKPFEGFSKFNPNAKFLKYEDDGMATIIYKKQFIKVKVSDITRK